MGWYIFFAALIIFTIALIIFAILSWSEATKCPECGKRFAMREIERKAESSYATTKDIEQKIRNNKGEITGRYTQTVPATTYIYNCLDQCKYCGFQRYVNRSKTYRD